MDKAYIHRKLKLGRMFLKNLRILGTFISIIIPFAVFGQNESDLVAALNQQLIPLTTVVPDSNFIIRETSAAKEIQK